MADQSPETLKPPKKPLHRSPNHPVVDLEKAIELAALIQDKYGTHEVPSKLAHKLWGYKEGSGIGDQCVAALKAYGLIQVSGKGEGRKLALTDEGVRITRKAPGYELLVRKAAVGPPIHREIIDHYGDKGLPDDALLRQYLVWDRPEGSRFNEESVDAFIARLRKVFEFSGIANSDTITESSSAGEKQNGDTEDANLQGSKDDLEAPQQQSRLRRRKSEMAVGLKEDVFSLDEGSVVLQWPERLSKTSAQDLQDWLELIGRKIKRAAESPASMMPDDHEE